MNTITQRTYLFIVLLMTLGHAIYGQTLQLEKFLPEEYHYNIEKEKEEDGMLATNYSAVDPKTKVSPFEIIMNEMPKSLMDINGVANSLEQSANNYSFEINLLQKEESADRTRRLYQISNSLSTVLILMQEQGGRFIMVEVELTPEDFKTVSLERWQKIFWTIQ